MRTTVTLDPDVLELLQRVSHRTGRPFKRVLNEAVRSGLAPVNASEAFHQPVFRLGRSIIDLTKALALAADLEDLEVEAKLEQGR